MYKFAIAALFGAAIVFPAVAPSQDLPVNLGSVHGDLQSDAQYYINDAETGAEQVDEEMRLNGYVNLIYTLGSFSAGARYEAYLNPILGFDDRYADGQGFAYRYATYSSDFIDVTAGDFYEQFGSGLILRAYEERLLGFDNAIDGLRVKLRPDDNITITGLIGRQRSFWNKSEGIIRGLDLDIDASSLFGDDGDVVLLLGGSMVSRFQADDDPLYILPENVASFAGRATLGIGGFNLYTEYAFKSNDPSATDVYFFPGDTATPLSNPSNYSYNEGNGLYVSTSYSERGLGLSLSAKRVDKMDSRGDRAATANNLNLNFLPPQSQTHTERLVTLFPYATQANGEIGVQGSVVFNIPRGDGIGGRYGTDISLEYARMHPLERTPIDTFTYETGFFDAGRRLFDDFNIKFSRRIDKDLKVNLGYFRIAYNKDIIEGKPNGSYGVITSNIITSEITYKITPVNSLRAELQYAISSQEFDGEPESGDWAFALVELALAPNWFFSISDEYNLGHEDKKKRIHYLGVNATYVQGPHRLQLNFARQREGIVCVGGVCRNVPAATGLLLTLASSF